MKRMLIQTQLSNYDTKGKFILEADSGWQMMIGRARVMLKIYPNLDITIMGPDDYEGREQFITDPEDINPDLWEKYGTDGENRLHYLAHEIIPNALVTRYDFDWTLLASALDLGMQKIGKVPKWDIVYINDPMHLRNFKAMFHIVGGYQPKFIVHSHFVDDPECPKFPIQASLWMGQCEAARKADVNFWQCESAMKVFFNQMFKEYNTKIVRDVANKSFPWDDGYSSEEIQSDFDTNNIRFDPLEFDRLSREKIIIFVPNRIGGMGRSSDYTNCGKFMFKMLPELVKLRGSADDFVVIAGNPSQKILNNELMDMCGKNGYISLVPNALNRDEFKFIAQYAHIALGLYDQDSYGGTAARECIDLGCLPFWVDMYEYKMMMDNCKQGYPYKCKPDFSDAMVNLSKMIDDFKNPNKEPYIANLWAHFHDTVRSRCSYEETTRKALDHMGLFT